MNDPKIQNEAPQPKANAPKRPYVKPAIIWRAPLEATAGLCSTKATIDPPNPCTTPLTS